MAKLYTDDDLATYDTTSHRYTLTAQGLNTLKGVDIASFFPKSVDADVPAMLKRISDIGYAALLAGVRNRQVSLYWLALAENRAALLEYLAEIGYGMLTYRSDPSADPLSRDETVSRLARNLATTSDLYWRGTFDFTIIPSDFLSSAGEDW